MCWRFSELPPSLPGDRARVIRGSTGRPRNQCFLRQLPMTPRPDWRCEPRDGERQPSTPACGLTRTTPPAEADGSARTASWRGCRTTWRLPDDPQDEVRRPGRGGTGPSICPAFDSAATARLTVWPPSRRNVGQLHRGDWRRPEARSLNSEKQQGGRPCVAPIWRLCLRSRHWPAGPAS